MVSWSSDPYQAWQPLYLIKRNSIKSLRQKEVIKQQNKLRPTLSCAKRRTLADKKAQCYVIVIRVSLNILMSCVTDILTEHMPLVALVAKQKVYKKLVVLSSKKRKEKL